MLRNAPSAVVAAGLLLAGASGAKAAGGAHVVDDAGVETSDACHLEAWASRHAPRQGLVSLAAACTRTAWPALEVGAGVAHAWADGSNATTVGPALKLNLRPADSGVGVALAAAGAWGVESGRLEGASLVAPVSFTPAERVRLNLNAGWLYGRAAAHRHEAFFGAQAEIQFGGDVSLMAEVFSRNHGRPGGQVGFRWTPGQGAYDLDLLVGRRVDGVSPRAITLGLTARR